ncbi:TRAP transporter large permease [Virgibacillus oceani]
MTIILFLTFIVLLIIGVPVAVSLGLAAVVTLFLGTDVPLVAGIQSICVDSFPLMAIPFFVLAGNIMTAGGISKRLVSFASMIVGRITGGLANVSIFASAIFAAISGSSPPTTAAIGGVMMPEMNKRHYDKYFTGATVAAAGTIGMVIPPSIPMILYAVLAGVSVSDMFIAGILPGLLLVFSMGIVAYTYAKKNNIPRDNTKYSFKDVTNVLSSNLWALLMPIIILGGIYLGLLAPTEAAAVAVFLWSSCRFIDI